MVDVSPIEEIRCPPVSSWGGHSLDSCLGCETKVYF